MNEEDVLAALDKPRAIYSLQQRLDPSNKSTDALQELLMRMRTEGKVKFDIKTGKTLTDPTRTVRTFKTVLKDGRVYVETGASQ